MGFHDANGVYRLTSQAPIRFPLSSFILAAGTPLAAFADGASPTPGLALDNSEAQGIRWNNHATPAALYQECLLPHDRKPGTPITVNILAAKTGATVGDATTFTIGAFVKTKAQLATAGTDAGGASSAMTGNATSLTVQHLTRTLAASALPAPSRTTPATLMLSIKPTDALLGTDDVTVLAVWLDYEKVHDPS